MDTESPRTNEEILHALIEKADPRLMGMIGMQALHVLALQMPTEKFQTFIEGAVQRGIKLGSQAGLQPKQSSDQQPDQTAIPQQPTPAQ
jgi:hypothetical protein